jgi:hypothetical protein
MKRTVPVVAFAVNGTLVVGSDEGEWGSLAGSAVTELPSTGQISACVQDVSGVVTAACWEPRLEQLRDGAWTSIALSAPALALAATDHGLVLADTSGGIARLAGASHVPMQELTSHEPIVELVGCGGGIAALSMSGTVSVAPWPATDGPLVPVATHAIGRVHAIWPGIRPGTVLVAGATGLGVLEHRRLVAVATDFGEPIAGATVVHGRALIWGDRGGAWIIDERLARVARVRPGASVLVGATAIGDRALGWTTDGALYAFDGSAEGGTRLAFGDIVLAVPDVDKVSVIAVRWTPHGGTRATREVIGWN